jgi:hypothetical protein
MVDMRGKGYSKKTKDKSAKTKVVKSDYNRRRYDL